MTSTDGEHRRRRHRSTTKNRSPKTGGSIPAMGTSIFRWLYRNPTAIVIALLIAAVFLTEVYQIPVRISGLFPSAALGAIFLYVLYQGLPRTRLSTLLYEQPTPWILLYVVWNLVSAVIRPHFTFQIEEAMNARVSLGVIRLLFGFGIFVASAYYLRVREMVTSMRLMTVIITVVGLCTIIAYGNNERPNSEVTGFFQGHEQLGSLVMLPLFMAVALAMYKPQRTALSLGSQSCAWILFACLLLSQTRSAWIGAAVGAIPILWFVLSRMNWAQMGKYKAALIVTPVLVIMGIIILITSTSLSAKVSKRLNTIMSAGEDVSLNDRIHRWDAAAEMTYQRPIAGWGLGSYPVLQSRWTGTGENTGVILEYGVAHSNIAHNFYIQLASETGTIGLALFIALNVSFFTASIVALKSSRKYSQPAIILLGSLASITATCGDMLASPSYNFMGESSIPWLWMGIGVNALRTLRRQQKLVNDSPLEVKAASPLWIWGMPLVLGIVSGAAVYFVGIHLSRA